MRSASRLRRAPTALLLVLLTAIALVPAPAAQAAPGLAPVRNVHGDPQNGAARIWWAEPYNAPDYRYADDGVLRTTVTASPGGSSCTASTADWTCLVLGLTNDVTYTFTAVTRDPDGDSATTPSTFQVTPREDLQSPIVSDETQSSRRLPVQGGDLVMTMRVRDSPAGLAGTPRLRLRSGDTELPTVSATRISGTANDGVYRAVLTVPAGPPWGWSVIRDPLTDTAGNTSTGDMVGFTTVGYAAEPTGVSAELRPGRVIRVGWTPSPPDAGQPLLRYTVLTPDGIAVATVGPDADSADIEVGDAWPGFRQQYVVKATTAAGDSGWSAPSPFVTAPPTEPAAPRGGRAWTSFLRAHLTWDPSSGHGSPVQGYVVSADPGGVVCRTVERTCSIDDLPRRTPVRLRVAATNAIGTGPSLDLGPIQLNDVPSRPADLQAELRGSTMSVRWSPVDWGGERGTYVVDTIPSSPGCSATETTDCRITGLDPNGRYQVRVRGINSTGGGPRTEAVLATVVTAPAPPSAVTTPAPAPAASSTPPAAPPTAPGAPPARVAAPTVAVSPGRARVAWKAPDAHGSRITGYRVTVRQGTKRQQYRAPATARSLIVRTRKAGAIYRIEVVAISSRGASKPSVRSFRAR